MDVLQFWLARRGELATLVSQHVLLVVLSTAVAALIGIPLGILAARRPRLASPFVALANMVQTVPSLAMFGFLLPVPLLGGVGARAAIVVLILYAVLPIVRTTIVGLTTIDRAVREAAAAMGMTPWQQLRHVELPLALPSILAGIRVAAVAGVGSATIAAAIGAGGLGEYIYRGLSMVDTTVILAGAIPAALFAIAVDGGLWWVAQSLARRSRPPGWRLGLTTATVMTILGAAFIAAGAARTPGTIVVGSKNFTEQVILGELLAQAIERYAGNPVERRFHLGSTLIAERALLGGEVDVYAEYTGTSLTAIFNQPVASDPEAVFENVRELYAGTGRTLLPPLGFNNTFAILVRGRDARELGLRTVDDVVRHAPGWRAGFGYEFLERPDGYSGLSRTYGLVFREPPRVMDLTLSYRALASGEVDLIAGDATAGLIQGLDLAHLVDNRRYFPPYDAAPVARAATLLRYPAVRLALTRLAGAISAEEMRGMNYAAEVRGEDPAAIARRFLDGLDKELSSRF